MIELRGESFIVRQNQRRAVGLLDDFGHGEGFARAGDAEQHLVLLARRKALHQFGNGPRLISARRVCGHQLKVHGEIIPEERRLGEDIADDFVAESGANVVLQAEWICMPVGR